MVRKVRVYAALRELYEGFVDSDGKISKVHNKKFKRVISERQRDLLVDILSLVVESDFLNEESQRYVKNKFITIEGINEELRKEKEAEIPLNNTVSRIMYGKKKVEESIGRDFYDDILSNLNLEVYEERVSNLKIKVYGRNEFRKNLSIKIPVYDVCREISEEDFKNFIATIAPYSKRQMKFVEESLDKSACGYFNYLVSEENLVGIDKDRALLLEALLMD